MSKEEQIVVNRLKKKYGDLWTAMRVLVKEWRKNEERDVKPDETGGT
jgi:hypothetical protein